MRGKLRANSLQVVTRLETIMPVILVVDDSKTDRVLIDGLLQKESLGWLVEFAESAEDAITKLTDDYAFAVDLVVTDMLMPGMNGLELVELIRERSTKVPVILISGQGSESLAVQAIKSGAASYVPKDDLSTRLVATIKQVLTARQSEQTHANLLECVADVRYRFEMPNDPALIPVLDSLLQQMAERLRLLDEESRTQFGITIYEAVINAMYHGNLELPAEELAKSRSLLHNGETVPAIEERRKTPPYSQRFVHVQALLASESIEVIVRDDGGGFDHASALCDGHNRGLTLIKNIVDDVSFNDTGNEIRMVKLRHKPGAKV